MFLWHLVLSPVSKTLPERRLFVKCIVAFDPNIPKNFKGLLRRSAVDSAG
jgi:hypothetical protein